jgi:hypothetical protein
MEKTKKKAKTATYNLTGEQLDAMFDAMYAKRVEEAKERATLDAIDISMVMVSNVSLKVLKDHFWKKTYDKKLHEFMDLFVDEYMKCQNNEAYIFELQEEMKDYNAIKFVKEE